MDLANDTYGHYNSTRAKTILEWTLISARAALIGVILTGVILSLFSTDATSLAFIWAVTIPVASIIILSIQTARGDLTLFRQNAAYRDEIAAMFEETNRQLSEIREDGEDTKKAMARIADSAGDRLEQRRRGIAGH